MDSTNFLKTCRMDPSQLSVTERYFTPKMIDEYHQCVLKHSNRLSIITIAPSHPILAKNLTVMSVHFDSTGNENRLCNKVSGKFKKGGQRLKKESVLCTVKCSDECEYTLYSCIPGTLVEVNQRLIENPSLLTEKPWSDGYIGIILPPFISSRRNFAENTATKNKCNEQ